MRVVRKVSVGLTPEFSPSQKPVHIGWYSTRLSFQEELRMQNGCLIGMAESGLILVVCKLVLETTNMLSALTVGKISSGVEQ